MKIQTPAAATVSARPQRPGPATPAPSVLPGLHTCCSWGTDGPGPSQVSAPTRVHRPCSLSDLSPLQDPVTVRSGVATFPEVLSSDNCHFRASGVLRLAPRVPCAEPWRALFAHITPGPPCSAHLLPPRRHPGSWSGWTAHLRCLHQAAIPSLPQTGPPPPPASDSGVPGDGCRQPPPTGFRPGLLLCATQWRAGRAVPGRFR